MSHDIHFWLGNETTQDESGSAAILSVHLDDYLGGSSSQHREVQEHESPLFLSYFKKGKPPVCATNTYLNLHWLGIRYLDGGVDSGFNKVITNAEDCKRLFHVKGKRNIRVRQVELKVQSMNQNDYFILDSGRKIFVYPPKKANIFQRTKANEIAKQIRDQDHHGRATVHILDDPISFEDRTEFLSILGCSKSAIAKIPEVAEEDDEVIEMKDNATITLYNATKKPGYIVGLVSGLLKISTKPLNQDMLKSDVSLIFCDWFHIFNSIKISDLFNSGHRMWNFRVDWKGCNDRRQVTCND